MQWVIRSSAQTLCDDLARAEEATDGKNSVNLGFKPDSQAIEAALGCV